MNNCVIVGGAPISDYSSITPYLSPDDFYIYCDSGLSHEPFLGFPPSLIVGDFDSHPNPGREVETRTLPREKDDTDTFYAAKIGVERGFKSFILLGATGRRLDHTLGNVSILLYLDSLGLKGKIVDSLSEMEILSREPLFISPEFPYFSLLAIDGTARGVDISNAKFPLANAEITPDYQYGISNEVIPGKISRVSVSDGRLLLIRVREG